MNSGIQKLKCAEWLFGFDFDGTLADVSDNHSVSKQFFDTLKKVPVPFAWGICTGRSLDFLLEGIEQASFPIYPDYIVAQERDLFYQSSEGNYVPDEERNMLAKKELMKTLRKNSPVLSKVKDYIESSTEATWIEIPEDPAGIIASNESEIQEAVKVFNNFSNKTDEIDFQRNTIYLRFTHRNYCKGTAVKYLRKVFDIPWANTLVMGDNYNDITMLNADVAKYYAAPSNSIDSLIIELRANNGIIALNNYSRGVAEIIEKLVISETLESS